MISPKPRLLLSLHSSSFHTKLKTLLFKKLYPDFPSAPKSQSPSPLRLSAPNTIRHRPTRLTVCPPDSGSDPLPRPIDFVLDKRLLDKRIVLSRINDYLTSNSLLNPHQSGFTKRHSTETLLTSLYNK